MSGIYCWLSGVLRGIGMELGELNSFTAILGSSFRMSDGSLSQAPGNTLRGKKALKSLHVREDTGW